VTVPGSAADAVQLNAALPDTVAGRLEAEINARKYCAESLDYAGKTTQEALKGFAVHNNFENHTHRTAFLHANDGIVFINAFYDAPNITGTVIFYEPGECRHYHFLHNNTKFYLYRLPFEQSII